ncbi:MAG: hypothetical protein HFJ29_09230 [Clostridia bacterium]|nr:hypothetical protein [Clostridia bacterium]
MRKISKDELMLEVKKCGFDLENMWEMPVIRPYHYHEWDHGYYSWGGYNGTRREFYKDLEEMVNFLYQYMNFYNIKKGIIAPLHTFNIFAWKGDMEKDDRYNDIYREAMELLKQNNIRKNSQAGLEIEIEGNRKIIEMVLEGAYRYVLELCLFFPNQSVIVEPTHHFDLMFFAKNFENEKNIIENIISNYKNLRYHENCIHEDI